jgi:hypothetical protein
LSYKDVITTECRGALLFTLKLKAMIVLKSESQVKSFIKRQQAKYRKLSHHGTDGCNIWGVKSNVFKDYNKIIVLHRYYCSGDRDVHTATVIAVVKITNEQ